MCSIMGLTDFNPDSFSTKMEEMLAIIRQVKEQFRDPVSIAAVRYEFKVCLVLVLCDSRVTFLGPGGPVHYLTLTSCSLS